jgi:hypothetical protein
VPGKKPFNKQVVFEQAATTAPFELAQGTFVEQGVIVHDLFWCA